MEEQNGNSFNLSEIFADLKRKRFFILRVSLVCLVLGVIAALFVHKKYEAHCVVVPQTSGSLKIGGNLGGLAALAGIEIGGGTSTSTLPITIYPNVFNNVNFRKELLQTPVILSKFNGKVPLEEYVISPKYKHFIWWYKFKAKTINYYAVKQRQKRLKEMNAMMERMNASTTEVDSTGAVPQKLPEFVAVDARTAGAINSLDGFIELTLDQKNNSVTISVEMPEPIAAAQVASATEQLLQKYIISFKTQKAADFLEFIQGRYDEAYNDYQEKRDRLARYQDSNTSLRSSVAQAKMTKLEEESLAAFDVYASMSQQLEQAKISEKEDTPVFTVVEPVVNPVEPVGLSRAMIVLLCLLLGCIGAVCVVAFKNPILDIIPNESLANWFNKEDHSIITTAKSRKKKA